ncbi:flagellar basal body rod protein FlgF [Erythrobacter sp. HL-111]|uniref:flagellar basal body rod protein FlgF n=1 Tax=Erythrobacter sp. HL-111 TaxID=1798193 RepID=UPI0006DA5F94|nr:flagellar basal body rod protein FlgF [Erythrobacter sp. HL-111]KPP92565.1 MAG: flagellar basal-body rod protein FlgF [Erythrobacteraceae bacterium HL-111]SDS92217.1 flagellar basal-body rod protein FlgF [Erythrobacter sp. HL-111]
MDRFIYTALTAMNAAMDRQRATANNLANASTPGFRREVFAVTPATLRADAVPEARAMARGSVRGADLTGGRVNPTGRPLDIAVSGRALIAFQGPDGGEVYSRRGDLRVGPTGVLENGEGLPVLGNAGPITVPAGFAIAIGADGSVLAGDPAAPGAGAETLDRIRLVSPEGSALAKGVDSFLKVPGGGVLPPDPTATVTPGALESSNVETAEALVQMIEAQRAFEQRARVIRTAGELDEAGSRLLSLQ